MVRDAPQRRHATLKVGTEQRRPRARSWGMQFCVLLRRALRAQLRNPTDVTARLLLSCWVGMVAGAPPRDRVGQYRFRVAKGNPTNITARLLLGRHGGRRALAPPRPRAACRHSACRRALARCSRA